MLKENVQTLFFQFNQWINEISYESSSFTWLLLHSSELGNVQSLSIIDTIDRMNWYADGSLLVHLRHSPS